MRRVDPRFRFHGTLQPAGRGRHMYKGVFCPSSFAPYYNYFTPPTTELTLTYLLLCRPALCPSLGRLHYHHSMVGTHWLGGIPAVTMLKEA